MRILRIAVLLVALAATLGVVAASASPAHLHANSPERGCDICFTAHAISYQSAPATSTPGAPQMREAPAAFCEVVAGYQHLYSPSPLTRGPPQTL